MLMRLTRREKGPFRSRRSVLFWNLRISIKALVPGRYRFFLGDSLGPGKHTHTQAFLRWQSIELSGEGQVLLVVVWSSVDSHVEL